MVYLLHIKNNEFIRKASGIDSFKLSYIDYEKLAKGLPLSTTKDQFIVDWEHLNIKVIKQVINIKTSK